jgi:hypothetical protein
MPPQIKSTSSSAVLMAACVRARQALGERCKGRSCS